MPSPTSEVGSEIYNLNLLQNVLLKHSSQDKGLKLLQKMRKATDISQNLYLLHQLFLLILSFSKGPFISLNYYL